MYNLTGHSPKAVFSLAELTSSMHMQTGQFNSQVLTGDKHHRTNGDKNMRVKLKPEFQFDQQSNENQNNNTW